MADTATVRLLSTQVPAHAQGLSDFAVRKLTGAYSPTNGNESLMDATPAEWLGEGDPAFNANQSNAPNVVVPWCGGAEDRANKRLFITGGGHDDGANNGLYIADFSGGSTWAGVTVEDISAVSIVPTTNQNHDPYPDGRPSAIHGYDGHGYHNGEFFRTGGSTYRTGSLDGGTYVYSMSGGWSSHALTTIPFGSGRILSVATNSSVGKALTIQRGSFSVAFWNYSSKTWSSAKTVGSAPLGGSSGYHSAACNETNGEVLAVQNGRVLRYTVDWGAETVSNAVVTVSGYSGNSAPVLLWDSARNSFWAFGGDSGDSFSVIHEITGSGNSWSATQHSLSGDSIGFQTNIRGMFNRAILISSWRVIAVVTDSRDAPYFIKIP